MARRKANRSTERGVRRAATNAVAVYLTALRAPEVPARSRARLVQRRTQVEQWLSEGELSPIEDYGSCNVGLTSTLVLPASTRPTGSPSWRKRS
jgi:hypothetical protein